MILVGVVPSLEEPKKLAVSQDYVDAVLRAGGLPVLFPMTDEEEKLRTLLDRVDGLLLIGGGDVEPALYGEERMPCCGESSSRRDAMELPICRMALADRKPILAICRGLQVLSCALGGTLYQDLGEQLHTELRHQRHDQPADPVHTAEVRPGTLLASVVGEGTLPVNSRHHQGIRVPGAGLLVNAVAPDGVIEGIEYPQNPFVLGLQWHPESLSARYPAHQKLFDAFVAACGTASGKTR